MTPTITRRTFVLRSVAGVLASGAIVTLPASHAALAQEATPQGATDFASLGLPTLDITVYADRYEGVPAETAAGRYLVNATVLPDLIDPVQVVFLQPPAGMSVDTFRAIERGEQPPNASPEAVPAGDGPPQVIYDATWAGGVSTTFPGSTGQAVIDLGPGEWMVFGGGPGAPQERVTMRVTGELPADLPEPEADITATVTDDAVDVEGSLTAGDHILRLESQGTEPHLLLLMKVPDDLTEEILGQMVTYNPDDPNSTPPAVTYPDDAFEGVLRTPALTDGVMQWVPVTLQVGTYAAMCSFPSAGSGAGHAEKGQYAVFTVAE